MRKVARRSGHSGNYASIPNAAATQEHLYGIIAAMNKPRDIAPPKYKPVDHGRAATSLAAALHHNRLY